jgi:hypothetical protein
MGAGETAYGVIWALVIIGIIIYIAIDGKLRSILAKNHILLMITALFAICVLTFGLLLMTGNTTMETFASEQAPGCFTEAKRGSDGKIHVQPGDQTFENLSEYTSALADQYSLGKLCIPPQVKEFRSPVEGVLGGLGVDAIGPNGVNQENATRVVTESDVDRPWNQTPINSVEDYDSTQVYENERNSRHGAMSTAVINDLSNKYKMDWAQLPFNSEAKAAQEDAFVAGRLDNVYREPKSGTFFKNMMGDGLFPPNTDEREQNERRMLNSYKPPQVAKNVEEEETSMIGRLVKKLFASDKDYEPVVEKSGDNKWDITELRPKARTEQWADADNGTSIDSAVRAGWIPPNPTMQIFDHGTNDPAFYRAGVADNDNGRFWNYKDFNKFTPGLERMFAPTLTTREWY